MARRRGGERKHTHDHAEPARAQRDFDFVDEQALSSLLTLRGGAFETLSGNQYQTILVPSATALSRQAFDRLRAFAQGGGRVVLLGRAPTLLVDRTFLSGGVVPAFDWAMVEPSGALTSRVLEALGTPDVRLGSAAPAVKYVHRRWRDADLYFFFNESAEPVARQAALMGRGEVQFWDAMSGRIEVVTAAVVDGGVARLPLVLKPYEAKLIVIGPRHPRGD